MGIRESIANIILPKSYKLGNPVSGGALQFFDMQMPPGWGYQSYLKAYGEIGILFSVVNVIAQAVSKVKWHLYELDSNGDKKEILQHELLDLFENPNPFQSRYQFMYLGTLYKLLVGEQFWQLNFNGGGKPAEIWQAPPAYMAVIPSQTKYIDHYEYKRGQNLKVSFTTDEIIHIKTPNPFNEYRGLSPAQALTTSLDTLRYAQRYNQKLFFNEAVPGLVIEYPPENMPPAEQRKELQQEWDERFRGLRNRGKTAFLYGGKVNTITMTNRDMDFQKLMLLSRDEICAAYHVPPSVLGITESVNRSNAETSQYQLAQYCIHPELSEIRESVNKELVTFYGDNLILDFDNPIPEDVASKATNASTLYKAGVITRNEARAQLDMEPDITDPASDEFYSAPVPSFGSPMGNPNEIANPTDEGAGGTKPKSIKLKTAPEDYWKNYVSHAESYEAHSISQLKEMFSKQKAEAISNLQSKKNNLLDVKKSKKQYIEAMTPSLTQVMAGAIKNGRELLIPPMPHKDGPIQPILSLAAIAWLKTRIGWAADQIGEESAARLAEILADGYKNGQSIDQISTRIQNEFDFFSNTRADRIARTEIMQTSSQGAIEGYKESGVVSKVKFYCAEDERTCEDCLGLHEEEFTLDDSVGVITVHPNCRCCWLPVVDGD